MIGPRITTVFRSRWRALLWSAGVLLTAYCSVPSQDESKQENDLGKALSAFDKAPQHPSGHAANPWAKDPH